MMMISRAATKRRLPLSVHSLSLFSSSSRGSAEIQTRTSINELRRRCYSSIAIAVPTLASSPITTNHLHCHTQFRFKRNDGSKSFFKQRKVNKKGVKKENRRKAAVEFERKGKHGAPGSTAGPRRQWVEQQTQELIEWRKRGGKKEEETSALGGGEYGFSDALLDDLMGNTAHLSSTPSPEPVYLGDYHGRLLKKVQKTMARYEKFSAKQLAAATDEQKAAIPLVPPPSDRQVALALRAYRDKNGTKAKPIGLHNALNHVIEELKIPTTLFGQECYTTLLTCCKTPKEAAKVMLIMTQRDVPICVYSWSILIDIHARIGDFEGCNSVMDQMKEAGVPPDLPAYTSLLAACFKVCNAGHVASSIRAQAGKLGWEKWKQMRINGIDADPMAYGAILRLLAAQGRAEQAINILDEMRQFKVKPTTLCFTAALKAVARSHETSIRYENGASRRFRRREKLTLYHGRMTRDIVIKAEQAEVVQDDGFVAALMLCAAAAGDSATAKAILLASEVRRMDHLRTIGPESHLAALRGTGLEQQDIVNGLAQVSGGVKHLVMPGNAVQNWTGDGQDVALSDAGDVSPAVASLMNARKSRTAFEEREYGGKDNRVLTALMKACASAINPKGMGDMWSGMENKGYLHENSLRLIASIQKPQYHDNTIPGTSGTEVGLSGMNLQDEGAEEMSKRLRRAKYEGGKEDPDWGFDMDTIDPQFYKMYEDDYQKRIEDSHEETMRRLHLIQGRDWTGMPDPNFMLDEGDVDEEIPEIIQHANSMYYNAESGKVVPRTGLEEEGGFVWDEKASEWAFRTPSNRTGRVVDKPKVVEPKISEPEVMTPKVTEPKEEWYFDQDEMKWKSRMVDPKAVIAEQKTQVSKRSNTTTTLEIDTSETEEVQEEYYFDQDEMKWKTRPKAVQTSLTMFEKEAQASKWQLSAAQTSNKRPSATNNSLFDEAEDDESSFTYEHFKTLMSSEMGGSVMPEEDAREMYKSMKQEFDEKVATDPDFAEEATCSLGLKISKTKVRKMTTIQDASFNEQRASKSEYLGKDRPNIQLDDILKKTPEMGGSAGFYDPDGTMASMLKNPEIEKLLTNMKPGGNTEDDFDNMIANLFNAPSDEDSVSVDDQMSGENSEDVSASFPVESDNSKDMASIVEGKSALDYDLEDLEAVLPGMPRNRLVKVREAFAATLSYPSMITLVPLLRENMPNRVDNAWLKRRNILNAYFCVQKAKEDNLVDCHMVNGMLQVVTSAGKVGRALAVHDEQFKGYGVEPNEYSDRLVLQMLVNNKRLSRALEFKEKIESDGRKMDLASYGSLIEYYAKREQVGSALMMLQECVQVHGSPPKEGDMAYLRLLCRQQDILKETGLVDLAGADPVEWLRHGEAKLKREKSKAGRRGVQEVLNQAVRA